MEGQGYPGKLWRKAGKLESVIHKICFGGCPDRDEINSPFHLLEFKHGVQTGEGVGESGAGKKEERLQRLFDHTTRDTYLTEL